MNWRPWRSTATYNKTRIDTWKENCKWNQLQLKQTNIVLMQIIKTCYWGIFSTSYYRQAQSRGIFLLSFTLSKFLKLTIALSFMPWNFTLRIKQPVTSRTFCYSYTFPSIIHRHCWRILQNFSNLELTTLKAPLPLWRTVEQMSGNFVALNPFTGHVRELSALIYFLRIFIQHNCSTIVFVWRYLKMGIN